VDLTMSAKQRGLNTAGVGNWTPKSYVIPGTYFPDLQLDGPSSHKGGFAEAGGESTSRARSQQVAVLTGLE
jgi:hypothetical protein